MNWKAIRIFPNYGPLTIFLSLCGPHKVWVWYACSKMLNIAISMFDNKLDRLILGQPTSSCFFQLRNDRRWRLLEFKFSSLLLSHLQFHFIFLSVFFNRFFYFDFVLKYVSLLCFVFILDGFACRDRLGRF